MSEAAFGLSLAAALAVLAGAVLGGAVQGVLGFGGGYVAVPVLAVVAPQALPAAVLLGFAPFLLLLARRDRASVDRRAFTTIIGAWVPGIVVGTVVVTVAPTDTVTLVIAAILLVAVAAAVAGWELQRTPTTLRLMGAVAGFTGTAAALGGPPMALVYHRAGAADRRGTLSVVFSVGNLLSIAMLAAVGEVGLRHVPIGLLTAAGLLLGSLVAPAVNRRSTDDALRRAVLAWAALGGLVAAARVLLG